ncbi:MAG: class I SAM-dependent methyltransferase [Gottschalkiaceae bacterium]|nr:MAG: class I SAM-dependent methyltransferase [Gottschalkiaceae bacterium]
MGSRYYHAEYSLLPAIAEYFNVYVDELLDLKPLRKQQYIQRATDDRSKCNETTDKLFQNRKSFWNDDYLKFLIDNVWKITSPINVIDFWCRDGYLGRKLLETLSKGSTYSGIDNAYFIIKAKETFRDSNISSEFNELDIYSFKTNTKYDLSTSQTCLRHLNMPMEALANMAESVRKGGLVVFVEVNRNLRMLVHT